MVGLAGGVDHDCAALTTLAQSCSGLGGTDLCRQGLDSFAWNSGTSDPAFLFLGLYLPLFRLLSLLLELAHEDLPLLPLFFGLGARGPCRSRCLWPAPGGATLLSEPLIVFRGFFLRRPLRLLKF